MKNSSLKKAIFETCSYYLVFDYLPSLRELNDFLHVSFFCNIKDLTREVKRNKWLVSGHVTYIKKSSRIEEMIQAQNNKKNASKEKMKIVKKVVNLLKLIPTVCLIGVSGNLSMMNSNEDDDIDLFIITEKHSAWATRLMISLLLIIIGKKRMFKSEKVKNKICLNLLLDMDNLTLLKQNIYIAHEIAQLKIILDRNGTMNFFLSKNIWAQKYLANFWNKHLKKMSKVGKRSIVEKILIFLLKSFEKPSRYIQFKYMQKKITKEILSEGIMMFHPRDYSGLILRKYNQIRLRSKTAI